MLGEGSCQKSSSKLDGETGRETTDDELTTKEVAEPGRRPGEVL